MTRSTLETLFLLTLVTASALAQTAEISGLIADPSGLPVPNASVSVENRATGVTRSVTSNSRGFYSIPALPPGSYDLTIAASGFKSLRQTGIVVEVDQRAALNLTVAIGDKSESVTVEGDAALLNTSNASVSTLISNGFVKNLPMNGRSFSSLIELTPGVVLVPDSVYEQGQFSVNGQHPDANYFMVDGVSANVGTAGSGANLSQGGAGQLPATSAFGGTSNLVPLDALEEFRIQTSTFAPEYGRTPGAQISVVTKSGTNTFHGTAFEYLRNDQLDANDWFANANRIARPALRQNDFGGVLGGPIRKDKFFFFGSYEGLRVRQPQIANAYEPTLATRAIAPPAVQPFLNAFPVPNGQDLGNGTAIFAAGYSNPSSLDSYGIRADYLLTSKVTIFGRYNDAPSYIDLRSAGSLMTNFNNVLHTNYRIQTFTLGSNQSISARVNNELRYNYSRSNASAFATIDDFGGGTPPAASLIFPQGYSTQNAGFEFAGDLNPYGLRYFDGDLGRNLQQQINVTDTLSFISGAHQMKFGMDYRRLQPTSNLVSYELFPIFLSLANILTDAVPEAEVGVRKANTQLAFDNWSLFAQDTWKAARTLTVTYGLRWEYNAPPTSPNGTLPFTIQGIDNFATMTLAPPGTPLWKAQRDDFAPRAGVAWQVAPSLVLRVGAGIFYDLGYSTVADGASAFPYAQTKIVTNTTFPLSAAIEAPPPFTNSPPASFLSVVNPNHVLPRTYEWNAAIEKAIGRSDVATVTYLGAGGRELMRHDIYNGPNPKVVTGEFDVESNDADSTYNALQLQYRHRMAHNLQMLLSYTWAHAIDDDSSDAYFVNLAPTYAPVSDERGSSDYDIRHTFSGAVSYNIPAPGAGVWKSVLGNWAADSIVYARSAPPVNVVTGLDPFPAEVGSGAHAAVRPNLVRGVPLWIANPNVAGGREISAAAFRAANGAAQGDLGRNAVRGFDAAQVDLTLRREFPLRERLALQARAEFFNIFNHPNFAPPLNFLSSPQFGQATQMLGSSLGTGGSNGGLSPLYQVGGPRSIQLALKLLF